MILVFKPHDPSVLAKLLAKEEEIRTRMKDVIVEKTNVPRGDVIVHFEYPYASADLNGAAFELTGKTTPNEDPVQNYVELVQSVASLLYELGLTSGPGAEVWIWHIGTWALVKGQSIVDDSFKRAAP